MIPFLDVAKSNEPFKADIMVAVSDIISSGQYVMGKYLEKFEQEFAEYIGTKYAVGVNSGTDALTFSLLYGSFGTEVLTTAFTFPATIMSIITRGYIPVFVDVDETGMMDAEDLKKKITPSTTSIMPVHFMGQPCDMNAIEEAAGEIPIIEDACQAVGAIYHNKRVGSIGDAGCFSFFPTKNLSCCGDGGMVTTNNKQIYDAVKLARNFGRVSREDFKHPGRNSRLDEIQAAILSIKLPYIDDWIDKRNEAAEYYTENIDFLEHLAPAYGKSAYHLYVVKTPDNKKYIKAMAEKGVDCRSHYSVPCHKMGFVNDPVSLPVTEKLCSQVMSLPISENIARETQDIIIQKLKEVHDEA